MKETEVKRILNHLAEDAEVDNILLFLNNCADGYKNQFLYTSDPFYKGMVTAFVVLKDNITQAKPENRNKKSVLDKVKAKVKY